MQRLDLGGRRLAIDSALFRLAFVDVPRLAGDTAGLVNLGRDNVIRVMQRSSEMLAERGKSGESIKNADVGYQGERAAARTAGILSGPGGGWPS